MVMTLALGPATVPSGGWRVVPSPNPSGSTNATLAAVSCPSTRTCTAVGDYALPGASSQLMVEAWDGTTWSLQPIPVPAHSDGSSLVAVSCPLATSCMAVGSKYNSGVTNPLAAAWDGSAWTILAPVVAVEHDWSYFWSVSCPSA